MEEVKTIRQIGEQLTFRYIGLWQKPALCQVQYEAYYGLSLNACMQKNKLMRAKGFVATSFHVFNNKNESCTYVNRNFYKEEQIIPRQISHFMDNYDHIQYVVLWSDVNEHRYPNPPPLWNNTNIIPTRFLKGTLELISESQLNFLVRRVEHFMKELNIPGLSIAISKKEQLKFAAVTYWWNSTSIHESYFCVRCVSTVNPLCTSVCVQIGSVSKPVTASAIMLLVDQGKIKLDERLFGQGSFFGGWDNLASDAAWIEPEMGIRELIGYVIENIPLDHKPGTMWVYSNFGYQLLGYLISHLTGMSYENFVKKYIFAPAGVYDVQIARPTISDRAPREVMYYMSGNGLGFNPYEMLPPERIGPWGGWIASPIQLLMFMSVVDGFSRRQDILSQNAIYEWSTPSSSSNETYGSFDDISADLIL
uniref:Beta-lactamase domain-containing protein n=1 Tax=Heterorhabditis bacteriophora TaxID=37862 RepID=A0A1I7XIY2_HETBA